MNTDVRDESAPNANAASRPEAPLPTPSRMSVQNSGVSDNRADGGETDGIVQHRPPAPLLPVAVGLMAGIVLDRYAETPPFVALGVTILAAILALRLRAVRPAILTACVAVAAAGVGAMRHGLADRHLPPNHISRFTADEPALVTLTGEVLDDPDIRQSEGTPYRVPPNTRFLLEARELAGQAGPIPTSGCVQMRIDDALPDLRAGSIVTITGWLTRPRGPANPGQYDWRLYLRRTGVRAMFSADHAESVRVVQSPTGPGIAEAVRGLRRRLRQMLIHRAFDERDDAGGIISAVVLGQRSAVGRAMNEVFKRTGCTHFLAASGMNVAWLALPAWALLRLLGIGYRATAVVVAVLMVSYLFVAEPEPSILRAVIIGVLACIAIFLRGRPNSGNWLACSAIVVLMIDPRDLFRPAFQFSFISVAAVVHLTPRILGLFAEARLLWIRTRYGMAAMVEATGLPPIELTSLADHPTLSRSLRFAVRALGLGSAVSLAAWLAAAPLAAHSFNQFTPLGWVWTQLLIVPAFLATLIGYLKIPLDLLFPSSALVTGPLLSATTHWMTAWATAFSHAPGTVLPAHKPSAAWTVCAYILLCTWTWRRHWLRRRWVAPLLLAGLIGWWAIPPRWVRMERDALVVWMLAVGDGTGTVIELPDGRVIVYDFGTRSRINAEMLAREVLAERGIDHVDAVYVSHPDSDHFNAIEAIADAATVDRVVLNDQFEPLAAQHPSAARFLERLRKRGLQIESQVEISDGLSTGVPPFAPTAQPGPTGDNGRDAEGVRTESLWPPPRDRKTFVADNDASTVLRITWQGRSILLTGDITEAAMAGLLARTKANPEALHADALALPHHGSMVFNTADFIRAVAPSVAIRSSGQRRALTVNGIERACGPARYLNTADVGCVKLTIRKGELTIETPFERTGANP